MLILEGAVTVSADSARGAIPISTLRAPSLVGELGALAQLPRSATARACTPVTALRFGRATLVEIAQATPSLLIDVIGRMGDRLRKFNGAISLYTHALGALERQNSTPRCSRNCAIRSRPHRFWADLRADGEQLILRRQRDDEMASAAVIQRALLPRVKQFAEESNLDVWAAMTPARDVGGDFFDLVPLADGRVAIGVGDVCGKGVPAALFMGITRTLIRINLRESPDLPGAIVKANAFLADNNAGQLFATALYAAYDPRTGALEYCNCGHLPGYIRRPGGFVETLPVGGLPVGLFDPMKMMVSNIELRPGDLFLLYTDGVTEAEDPDTFQFGEERLESLLARKGHGANASQWIARIEAAVREFARGRSQFDDITCLALKR